uniref:Uncharacterized protein n=1 Tax=Romanomermis culicivorax TaxID=13658 RepID=A0A915HQ35_ROMCU
MAKFTRIANFAAWNFLGIMNTKTQVRLTSKKHGNRTKFQLQNDFEQFKFVATDSNFRKCGEKNGPTGGNDNSDLYCTFAVSRKQNTNWPNLCT